MEREHKGIKGKKNIHFIYFSFLISFITTKKDFPLSSFIQEARNVELV